jgi:hypothetical protein
MTSILKVLLLVFVIPIGLFAGQENNHLFNLPLDELMTLKVKSSTTLTKTAPHNLPATLTKITKSDIQDSGARNLVELLDTFVPNFQWLRHHFETTPMGIRGIISDTNDNMMILVNGRVMNERTHYGAIPEKNLVLLDDIHYIDIIRGSGSAIYGYGATTMVINIITETGHSFNGSEITAKLGAIEEFQSLEIKYGTSLSSTSSLFLYSGISNYTGSDQRHSPLIFGSSFNTKFGKSVNAGEPVPYPINNDQATNRNLMPIKLFAHLNWDQVTLWSRYTRSGQQFAWNLPLMEFPHSAIRQQPLRINFNNLHQQSSGYQQGTLFFNFNHPVTRTLSFDLDISYDTTDYERALTIGIDAHQQEAYREEEYYTKLLGRWTPNHRHALALGTEFSYEKFGLQSLALSHIPPKSNRFPEGMPQWATKTGSVLSEYQWNPSTIFTFFLGGRIDRNSLSPWLISPRFSTILHLNDTDSFKLLLSRSARIKFAEDLKWEYNLTNTIPNPDYLNSIELRFERQRHDSFLFGTSIFYQDLEFNKFLFEENTKFYRESEANEDSAIPNTTSGHQKHWGIEVEVSKKSSTLKYGLSHAYTKLVDFSVNNVDFIENSNRTSYSTDKSAAAYGFGSDISNWSNHISKAFIVIRPTPKWSFNGALKIYWGYPGSKDYLDFQSDKNAITINEDGKNKLTEPSAFLNLGVTYHPTSKISFQFKGHDLLGLMSKKFNKRFYFNGFSAYRVHASSLSIALRYKF